MTDLERHARVPDPPYRSFLVSSRERQASAPGTPKWFSNYDGGSFEEVLGDEKVMLDVEGPGAITRIWSANPKGTWRFYVDDLEEPVLAVRLDDLTGAEVAGLRAPLAYVSARGHSVYLPIPFARRIRVTTDGDIQFYQFNYRRYPEDTVVRPFSMEALEDAADARAYARRRLTQPALPDGETIARALGGEEGGRIVVPAGRSGGAIRRMVVRPRDTSEGPLRETLLLVTFDGRETVRVPLGDFFGGGPGINPLDSLPVAVDEQGVLTSRWVMPFEREATVELQGAEAEVEVVHGDFDWDERSMHFHARWRRPEELHTEPIRDWELVTLEGHGVYVGTVLNVLNPVEKWWGEGDERIRVDDGPWDEWLGTGTEDYFGYAWCSTELFSRPFHGQPRADGPVNSGRVVNYRWHLLDAIPFERKLEFLFEIHHWQRGAEAVTLTYDAVVVWYARPGSRHSLPPFVAGALP